MPFLGSTPAEQYQSLAKQTITGDGSTAYTLNRSVTNAYDMEVFINNVRQEPDTSYTASGNTITFTAAVTSGDSCYLIYQGQSVGSVNPPANSVGTTQIANNTVTTAHLHTGLSVPDSNIAAMSASKLTGQAALANMPTGSVLQLKQNIDDTSTSISVSIGGATTGYSMTGWFYTGVSLAFTPFSSSSRIILNSTINFATTNHGERISFKIVRDTGSINPVTGMGAIDSNRRMCHSSSLYMNTGSDEHLNEISMYTYDEPSTTSTVTYKVYVNQNAGSGATVYINRPDNFGDAYYIPKAISTLTGFEVAQ